MPYSDEDKTETINVLKPFNFTHADGTTEAFVPGSHSVHPDLSNHWYVLAHTDKAPNVSPQMGTREYAERMRKVRDARAAALAESDQLVAEAEAALKKSGGKSPAPGSSSGFGPEVEGHARRVSPGLKNVGDMTSNVGPVGDETGLGYTGIGSEATGTEGNSSEDAAMLEAAKAETARLEAEAAENGNDMSSDIQPDDFGNDPATGLPRKRVIRRNVPTSDDSAK